MCDHCRTYKPLLNGAETTTFYEQERPKIIDTSPKPPKPEDRSNGCCSWRQTCCGGGCCNVVGNCCSSGLKAQSPPKEKQFNYGYNQPETASYSMGMTAPAMPDRVPCSGKTQERKLPMCFGGDCAMSTECLSKTGSTATANFGMESKPRESER